jgi:hypothetical protein
MDLYLQCEGNLGEVFEQRKEKYEYYIRWSKACWHYRFSNTLAMLFRNFIVLDKTILDYVSLSQALTIKDIHKFKCQGRSDWSK